MPVYSICVQSYNFADKKRSLDLFTYARMTKKVINIKKLHEKAVS